MVISKKSTRPEETATAPTKSAVSKGEASSAAATRPDGSAEEMRQSNSYSCSVEETCRRGSRDSEVEMRDGGSCTIFPYESSAITAAESASPLETRGGGSYSSFAHKSRTVTSYSALTLEQQEDAEKKKSSWVGLMELAQSDAETFDLLTNSATELKILDSHVRNEKNQMVIQAAQFGGVDKLKLQVSLPILLSPFETIQPNYIIQGNESPRPPEADRRHPQGGLLHHHAARLHGPLG